MFSLERRFLMMHKIIKSMILKSFRLCSNFQSVVKFIVFSRTVVSKFLNLSKLQTKMSAEDVFKKVVESSFDYDEAMRRQNLNQVDIDRLREKVKDSKYVPKYILDKQAS